MSDVPFRKVCDLTDIPDGGPLMVELDGEELTVYRRAERVWCTEGRCPHAFESMGKAVLDGNAVECLAHRYSFDLETGKAIKPTPGACFIKVYPVKVEGNDVMIAFEGGEDEW